VTGTTERCAETSEGNAKRTLTATDSFLKIERRARQTIFSSPRERIPICYDKSNPLTARFPCWWSRRKLWRYSSLSFLFVGGSQPGARIRDGPKYLSGITRLSVQTLRRRSQNPALHAASCPALARNARTGTPSVDGQGNIKNWATRHL
jgi:hypothetical protein